MIILLRSSPFFPLVLLLLGTFGPLVPPAQGADRSALIDDFTNATQTSRGATRLLIDDKGMGSQSVATQRCENGVVVVRGELKPGRGVPAFISVPLLLTPDGKPEDVSAYAGVRLRVKLIHGGLTVQVSSAEVDNFDYHSAPVVATGGEFVEVRVPFATMKRAWSEQTPLNLKHVTSVNLVAFALAPGAFAYDLDEIGFY